MRNKVIASVRQNYGGRWRLRGEKFETDTQQDAEDLVALNFAQWDGDGYEAKRINTYKRRDMKAEDDEKAQP